MTPAVSLGSFEAGVLTELLWALEHPPDGLEFELDVISGASAGAMTAGLVANMVMNDYSNRESLYKAWVEMVRIENLLADAPKNALLSTAPVRKSGPTVCDRMHRDARRPSLPTSCAWSSRSRTWTAWTAD
jgi:predicted acylesterase/phospholipase RssA